MNSLGPSTCMVISWDFSHRPCTRATPAHSDQADLIRNKGRTGLPNHPCHQASPARVYDVKAAQSVSRVPESHPRRLF